jgi:hypothetical protein
VIPPLSVLDLCPIVDGGDARGAFARSVALAQRAEALGFRRFWLAEHHNMPGIASAATALVEILRDVLLVRLDGAAADLEELRVAPEALDRVLAAVARAAHHLHRVVRAHLADGRREELGRVGADAVAAGRGRRRARRCR